MSTTMSKREVQKNISKRMLAELSRMAWNKSKTFHSFEFIKDPDKLSFKISFSLPHPYSKRSGILIILRENGLIDKWVGIWDGKKPEKQEPINLFENKNEIHFDDNDARSIVKRLLSEIQN